MYSGSAPPSGETFKFRLQNVRAEFSPSKCRQTGFAHVKPSWLKISPKPHLANQPRIWWIYWQRNGKSSTSYLSRVHPLTVPALLLVFQDPSLRVLNSDLMVAWWRRIILGSSSLLGWWIKQKSSSLWSWGFLGFLCQPRFIPLIKSTKEIAIFIRSPSRFKREQKNLSLFRIQNRRDGFIASSSYNKPSISGRLRLLCE